MTWPTAAPSATATTPPGMARVTQRDCNAIAQELNARPRKRYNYQTPEERFHAA